MFVQFADLPVSDQDRALSFYTEKLGCRVVADVTMGASGWRWVELALGDAATHLHFVRRRPDHASDEPVMVLIDDDIDATVARLKGGQVEIVSEPGPAPYDPHRRVAVFLDSEGNQLVISSQPTETAHDGP